MNLKILRINALILLAFAVQSNSLITHEIKDNQPIPDLDFDQGLIFGYYYDLINYLKNEEGVLMLSFPNPGDIANVHYSIYSTVKSIERTDDIIEHFPVDYDGKYDNYYLKNDQNITLFFTKYLDETLPTKIVNCFGLNYTLNQLCQRQRWQRRK